MADVKLTGARAGQMAGQFMEEMCFRAMEHIGQECEPSDHVVAMMVGALLRSASAAAVRFDCTEEQFMLAAREAWELAVRVTREVDAEEDC